MREPGPGAQKRGKKKSETLYADVIQATSADEEKITLRIETTPPCKLYTQARKEAGTFARTMRK